MRKYRTLTIGVAILAVPCAWEATASAVLCWGIGRLDLFEFPYDQWLEAAPWWRTNWWLTLWVVLSAIMATLIFAPVVLGAARMWLRTFRRRPLVPPRGGGLRQLEPGVTDNHGHSQWRSMESARDLFPGPDATYGGVVVGEAYRVDEDTVAHLRFKPQDRSTWGRGGTTPLLIDPCNEGSGHSVVFAGTGGFKTVSAVSSVLYWTGSSVILDPSTELGPMLDAALKAQGKTVIHIGIPSEDDTLPTACGMDVLGWIDITHAEAEVHVKAVVSWIYAETAANMPTKGDNNMFDVMGRDLVTCLLAHLLWSDDPTVPHTLAGFVAGMAVPENLMLNLLAGINATSNSPMARRIAGSLMGCKADETFSGVLLNAVAGVSWLFVSAYADMVSDSTSDPRALLNGDTTVFLNLSLKTLETTPQLARVLVGALLNTVYMADGAMNGRVLFLLDEAARLGRMKALETARDTGRKYGVCLHMLFQSIGQMAEAWGRDGTRAWIDAAAWIGYAAIRAGGSGKELSNEIGTHAVLAHSQGENVGASRNPMAWMRSKSTGENVNTHEIKRLLMTSAELQQNLRADEIIIVPASGMPIRCGRAIYFRRPEMIAAVSANRFASAA